MEPQPLFHEVQRFRSLWLWALLVAVTAVCSGSVIGLVVQQIVVGVPPGEDGLSNPAAAAMAAGMVAVNGAFLAFMFALRLETVVRPDGLFVKFYPVHLKLRPIALANAASIAAVTYRPLWEYGGWGLRGNLHGRAYNVSGNRGVRIDYADGRHVLIGSQRPEALKAAIDAMHAESTPA